jgi:hypothetical protein
VTALIGASLFTSSYSGATTRLQAAQEFDGYLGAPWGVTCEKVYWTEGQTPGATLTDSQGASLIGAGVSLLVTVKPSRTTSVAQYDILQQIIELYQNSGATFDMALWNEPNNKGANGDFATAAAYQSYVAYYWGALNAAGVDNVYDPGMDSSKTAVTYYPGDAYVQKLFFDYYTTDFSGQGTTITEVLQLGLNNVNGPPPVGVGEWGLADGPGRPSVDQFVAWLTNELQTPLLSYVAQGGSLDKVMWFFQGPGGNEINADTTAQQIAAMLDFGSALVNASGPSSVSATADYPDFQTPQANADAISLTGVPLLALSGALLESTSFPVPGGAGVTFPTLAVTQLGYEIQVSCSVGSAATNPYVSADMSWIDSASGLVVAEETWVLAAASGNNVNTFIGTGPTKGDTLTVTITNVDPAVTATVSLVLLTNSRIHSRDRWIQSVTNNPPGITLTGGHPLSGVIASYSAQVIDSGNTRSFLLPLYAGDVLFYMDQQGNSAADSTFYLQPAPTSKFGTASMWSASPAGGVGSGVTQVLRFPRAHVLATYVNSGADNATINFKAIALDEAI